MKKVKGVEKVVHDQTIRKVRTSGLRDTLSCSSRMLATGASPTHYSSRDPRLARFPIPSSLPHPTSPTFYLLA